MEKLLCLYLVQHMQQQFYTDLGLYQQCSVIQKIIEFKDFSRLLSDFPVLFKADLIFKDFSRNPSKFKYFSSLWETCDVLTFWFCDEYRAWTTRGTISYSVLSFHLDLVRRVRYEVYDNNTRCFVVHEYGMAVFPILVHSSEI